MPRAKLVNRLRAVSVALAVLALLVFLNTSQAEDESESALRRVGSTSGTIGRVLAERHASAVANAWIEYASLVFAAACAVTAVGAGRVLPKQA